MSAPRYTARAFPAYRYVPGRAPHPRRDPRGHSHGRPEPAAEPFDPEHWWESEPYLYAIDLHNAGYWWECHEIFESLWRTLGRDSPTGRFLQALVWIAAAELKARAGGLSAARRFAGRATRRLAETSGTRLGIDSDDLRRRLEKRVESVDADAPLRIELSPPAGAPPWRRTRSRSR